MTYAHIQHTRNVDQMLGQRRTRQAKLEPTLNLCFMFAGYDIVEKAKHTYDTVSPVMSIGSKECQRAGPDGSFVSPRLVTWRYQVRIPVGPNIFIVVVHI